MSDISTHLFVIRRKDTGEYYKKVSPSFLKNWPADDPRRKRWTPDIELATFYPLRGVKSIRGNIRSGIRMDHELGGKPMFDL